MEWKNVWFYSSLFSFHRCYRRTWPCISLISWTYSHRPGFNKLFQEHNLQFEDFLNKHAFLLQKWYKPKKFISRMLRNSFLIRLIQHVSKQKQSTTIQNGEIKLINIEGKQIRSTQEKIQPFIKRVRKVQKNSILKCMSNPRCDEQLCIQTRVWRSTKLIQIFPNF